MVDPDSSTNGKYDGVDDGFNNFVNAIVRYIDEEGNRQEAIVTIGKNHVVHVKPFSGSKPCDSPTNPAKIVESGTILQVTKDPLEQLAEQIQVAINQLSPPTSQ
jgi:hypothetical protein